MRFKRVAGEYCVVVYRGWGIRRQVVGIVIFKFVKSGGLFNVSNKILQMNYSRINTKKIIDFRKKEIEIT